MDGAVRFRLGETDAESDNRIAGFVFTTDGKGALLSESANQHGRTYAVAEWSRDEAHDLPRARVRRWDLVMAVVEAEAAEAGQADPTTTASSRIQVSWCCASRARASPRCRAAGNGKAVFLEGTRYARDAKIVPRAFVDKVDIATGSKARPFESDTAMYESNPIAVDDDFERFVVTRETESIVPARARERGSGQLKRLTENKDITAEITRLPRKQIQVTSVDGKTLRVNVTMPANFARARVCRRCLVLSIRSTIRSRTTGRSAR